MRFRFRGMTRKQKSITGTEEHTTLHMDKQAIFGR
jgi:hypothetical protein